MKFYLVSELADILRLSESQIYTLIGLGKLRCHHFTTRKQGSVRVSEEQLQAYLRSTVSGNSTEPIASVGTLKNLSLD